MPSDFAGPSDTWASDCWRAVSIFAVMLADSPPNARNRIEAAAVAEAASFDVVGAASTLNLYGSYCGSIALTHWNIARSIIAISRLESDTTITSARSFQSVMTSARAGRATASRPIASGSNPRKIRAVMTALRGGLAGTRRRRCLARETSEHRDPRQPMQREPAGRLARRIQTVDHVAAHVHDLAFRIDSESRLGVVDDRSGPCRVERRRVDLVQQYRLAELRVFPSIRKRIVPGNRLFERTRRHRLELVRVDDFHGEFADRVCAKEPSVRVHVRWVGLPVLPCGSA